MGPATGLNPIISQRRDHPGFPRTECGMLPLASHTSLQETLDPATPSAEILVGLVAQWVDAGFDSPQSNGAVENRTLQHMTEEFARIVLPKVWEREDPTLCRSQ
jgi:hypothetical protein